MDSNTNCESKEEEATKSENADETEMGRPYHIVSIPKRISIWFRLSKYIAALIEIVPAIIAIMFGIWLMGAAMSDATRPDSEQLQYQKRLRLYRSKDGINNTCETDKDYPMKTKYEYCFKNFPLSNIGIDQFLIVGGAMVGVAVARIIAFILFYRKYRNPDIFLITQKFFLRWCVPVIAILFADASAVALIGTMLDPKGTESDDSVNDFTFTNDEHNHFYYGCKSLNYFLYFNFFGAIISRFVIAFANVCSEYDYENVYDE